jgi:CHAT domain-containing protein/Tfp pilus assembly protein PilF
VGDEGPADDGRPDPTEVKDALRCVTRATTAVRANAPDAAARVQDAVGTRQLGTGLRKGGARDLQVRWAAAYLELGSALRTVDPSSAIIFADEAMQTYPVGDPSRHRAASLLTLTLGELGFSRLRGGDAVGAQAFLERAATTAKEIAPRSAEYARLNDLLGATRSTLGDDDGASDAFFVAMQVWAYRGQMQYAQRSLKAMAQIGREGGLIRAEAVAQNLEHKAEDFQRNGLHEIAGAAQGEALALRLEVARRGTGVALEDAARELAQAGAYTAAAEKRHLALKIFEALDPNSQDTAVCLTNLGIVEMSLGELDSARRRLMRALKLLEALPPTTTAKPTRANSLAWTWSGLARVARIERELETAEMWARRAVHEAERDEEGSADHAYMLSELGYVLLIRRDDAAAIEALEHALRIFEARDPTNADVISQLTGLSAAYRRLGQTEKALELLRHAETLTAERQGDPRDRGDVLLGFALLHHDAGELEQAEQYAQRALDTVRTIGEAPPELLGALNALGQIRLGRLDLDGALRAFDEAIPIAERVRDLSAPAGHQGVIFAELLAPYTGAITALLRRAHGDDASRAFAYAERSRASDLVALLGNRAANVVASSPEDVALLERERALARQIAESYARFEGDVADPKHVVTAAAATGDFAEAIKAQIAETVSRPVLEQELQAVRSQIRERFPALATVRPEPIRLVDAQHDLAADALLVEYAFTGDELRVWTVSKTAVYVSTSATPSGQIIDDVARLVLHLRERSKPTVTRDPAVVLSRDQLATLIESLSAALIGPVPADTLRDARCLRIVPDAVLHYLPFELLAHPARSGEPLVAAHSLAYGASATVLHTLGGAPQPNPWAVDFIGYGDVPPPIPGSQAAKVAATRGVVLGRLEHTRREVEELAGIFGERARVRLASDATEHSVRMETGDVRYVHFATHGLVADGDTLHGGLLLAPPRSGETWREPLDDYLQTFEIFDLGLSAELVVVSACRTGVGRLQDGEGIRGLAHALFAAGARCAILSLWSVPDSASAELMVRFYRGLRAGGSIARALADAKNEIRGIPGWSEPFYWAAFVALGPADLPPAGRTQT